MDQHQLFTNIIVVIGALSLVSLLSHALRLPVVAGFLLTGIIVGPGGLRLISSNPNVAVMAEGGAILLMFTIGLEFSFQKMQRLRRVLLGLGFGQFALTMVTVATGLNWAFSMPWPKAIFIGGLMAMSSSAVVFKLLEDSRDMQTPYGQSSLGILLFQDLAVIPFLLLTPLLAGEAQGASWSDPKQYLRLLMEGLSVMVLIYLGTRWVVPKILERAAKTRSREVFFFSVLAICVGTALAISNLGLSLSLGAFFAGMMISESPYGKQAVADFVPFRDNFIGLFFVAIGMMVNSGFLIDHFSTFILLTVSILLVKFICLFSVMWMFGNSSSLAIITGLLLVQVGEFSFILAEKGRSLNLLTESELQYFLGIAVVSLSLTPFIFRMAPIVAYRGKWQQMIPRPIQELALQMRETLIREPLKISVKSQSSEQVAPEAHVILIGFGLAGQNLAYALKSIDIPYRIVDLNHETVEKYRALGEPIIWGDASKIEILEQLHIHSARVVMIFGTGSSGTDAILRTVRQLRPEIQILMRVQYFRDLENLQVPEGTETVVAEFEASLETLNRCLRIYGVSPQKLYEFIHDTRKRLLKLGLGLTPETPVRIDLPGWDIMSSLRPVPVERRSFAEGKTLTELDLRKNCGVTIISIFRQGQGAAFPTPDFRIEAGDVLYMVGPSEGFLQAEELLCINQKDIKV